MATGPNPQIDSRLEIALLEDQKDIELLAKFNASIHGKGVGEMTRDLALRHPDADAMRWLCVREKESGDIISTVVLLPWTLRYGDAALPAGELGVVGTREDWRRRGLATALVTEFNRHLDSGGYLMSHCAGIGYFYRQYGYEYCEPFETQVQIEHRQIERMRKVSDRQVSLRSALISDIGSLSEWYDQTIEPIDLVSVRSKDQWRFLLGGSSRTGFVTDVYIIESDGNPEGYCRIHRKGFGDDALVVGECSGLDYELYSGFFGCLAKKAIERDQPVVQINLRPTHPAVLAAKDAGAKDSECNGWQIRIPKPMDLLLSIRSVLDSRLAVSDFSTFSGRLLLNLYRQVVVISIADGKIQEVSRDDSADWEWGCGIVDIPPNLFAPLVFGQKHFEECSAMYPDSGGNDRGKLLFDALFPRMNGALHFPY